MASHNISACRIQRDFQARRAASSQQSPDDAAATAGPAPTIASSANANEDSSDIAQTPTQSTRRTRSETKAQEQKRKREEAKAIEKIKAARDFKSHGAAPDEDDDVAMAIYREVQESSVPLPGQMANCEICGKRFTVTPYSRAGPNGGLLCNPCGKDHEKQDLAAKRRAQRISGPIGKRRKVQSKILDGTSPIGAKSLMTLCITTLTQNIDLADELGDLPPNVVDKIARELSKRRLLDSRTLDLFLQSSADTVQIYDGGKLTSDDMIRIFQTIPGLETLKIRNAIQFKDEVMDYLISRHAKLEDLYLHGANLVTESMWKKFLQNKGTPLKSLRVYFTDQHFGDDALALLSTCCPSLLRLKVRHNQKVTGDGVKKVAKLKSLQHLGFQLDTCVHPDVYVHVLNEIGSDLRTFSLTLVPDMDNTVLDAIHTNCRQLRKLRITDSEVMTDDGFARLFRDWKNPALTFIDLSKCRQLDSVHPRQNPDNIGLCSNGFRALMAHSGQNLMHLNIHACRHISRAAFEDVFGPDKVYKHLTELEVSFCEEVDDFVVGSIFRSCPNLRNLNIFGCMKVRDVLVPRGKILVGMPNALGMVIEGDH